MANDKTISDKMTDDETISDKMTNDKTTNDQTTTDKPLSNQMTNLALGRNSTSGRLVAIWMKKLAPELRNQIYRDTYDLVLADLTERASSGVYSEEAGSTHLLCEGTHDALAGIKQVTGEVSEARSIWLAEYWPRVCKLKFRFTSVRDYVTCHLPFATVHKASLQPESVIMIDSPESLSELEYIHRAPRHSDSDQQCSCSDTCALTAFLTRESNASRPIKVDLQHEIRKWWALQDSQRTWATLMASSRYAQVGRESPLQTQSLGIRGKLFKVQEVDVDEDNGYVSYMEFRGPLAWLNWSDYEEVVEVEGRSLA